MVKHASLLLGCFIIGTAIGFLLPILAWWQIHADMPEFYRQVTSCPAPSCIFRAEQLIFFPLLFISAYLVALLTVLIARYSYRLIFSHN